MLIGGINTLTLLDYPDKVACIIFTVGCNFRCGFCHNAQFVLPEAIEQFKKTDFIPEKKIFKFLESRKGLLDGVVISGGEPTLQPDLLVFLKKIKDRGFLVKLDTNGTHYEVVNQAIEKKLIDYVAMDIKSSPQNYNKLAGTQVDITQINQTKERLMKSNIDYEFRTTVLNNFHSQDEIRNIAEYCKGAKKLTIQNFRNKKVLDPNFKKYEGLKPIELETLQKTAELFIKNVQIEP